MPDKPRIVIVGAGFGGLYTYLNLHRKFHKKKDSPQITIINKQNYFLFTPLLHEVATGSVNQTNIIQPVRQILDGCLHDFVVAEAVNVDTEKQIVHTTAGEVPYDYLVMALGSETNYYNFSRESVYTLKDLTDARELKNKIISMFEQADKTEDDAERKKLLTFAVIGGGPTGAELAAELCDFAGGTLLKAFPRLDRKELSIHLIQSGKELIPQFDPVLRRKALRLLERKNNIQIHLNTKVAEIKPCCIELNNDTSIPTALPILVSGVKAVTIPFYPSLPINDRGQIPVNGNLQVFGLPNVFLVGDMAAIESEGQKVPQTAQAAEAAAKVAAHNIIALMEKQKPLRSFNYIERGQLVSLGRWNAVAEIYGFKFFGRFAWWVWRTIYASKLVGWVNRIRTVLDWTIDIFYPRDISKLEEVKRQNRKDWVYNIGMRQRTSNH